VVKSLIYIFYKKIPGTSLSDQFLFMGGEKGGAYRPQIICRFSLFPKPLVFYTLTLVQNDHETCCICAVSAAAPAAKIINPVQVLQT